MSYVKISDTLYYGIHPQVVDPLLKFDNYVNLTQDRDFSTPFTIPKPDREYHNFPIKDRGAPTLKYLTEIIDFLLTLEGTIYIFCKGGHGRSGTIMSVLYGKINGLNNEEAMKHIDTEWRAQRDMKYLRPKIIALGSPQTRVQKTIIKKYLG